MKTRGEMHWIDPCATCCTHLLVGHSVVPPKEACSDEICNHYIHSIVVMGQKDAENPHSAQGQAKPLVPPEPFGGICQTNIKTTSRVKTPEKKFSFTAQRAIKVRNVVLLFTTRCRYCIVQVCQHKAAVPCDVAEKRPVDSKLAWEL